MQADRGLRPALSRTLRVAVLLLVSLEAVSAWGPISVSGTASTAPVPPSGYPSLVSYDLRNSSLRIPVVDSLQGVEATIEVTSLGPDHEACTVSICVTPGIPFSNDLLDDWEGGCLAYATAEVPAGSIVPWTVRKAIYPRPGPAWLNVGISSRACSYKVTLEADKVCDQGMYGEGCAQELSPWPFHDPIELPPGGSLLFRTAPSGISIVGLTTWVVAGGNVTLASIDNTAPTFAIPNGYDTVISARPASLAPGANWTIYYDLTSPRYGDGNTTEEDSDSAAAKGFARIYQVRNPSATDSVLVFSFTAAAHACQPFRQGPQCMTYVPRFRANSLPYLTSCCSSKTEGFFYGSFLPSEVSVLMRKGEIDPLQALLQASTSTSTSTGEAASEAQPPARLTDVADSVAMWRLGVSTQDYHGVYPEVYLRRGNIPLFKLTKAAGDVAFSVTSTAGIPDASVAHGVSTSPAYDRQTTSTLLDAAVEHRPKLARVLRGSGYPVVGSNSGRSKSTSVGAVDSARSAAYRDYVAGAGLIRSDAKAQLSVAADSASLWDLRVTDATTLSRFIAAPVDVDDGELWYFAVRSRRPGRVTAWVRADCPGDCTRHGQCGVGIDAHRCTCDLGWRLWADCSVRDLRPAVSLPPSQWWTKPWFIVIMVLASIAFMAVVAWCVTSWRRKARLSEFYRLPEAAESSAKNEYLSHEVARYSAYRDSTAGYRAYFAHNSHTAAGAYDAQQPQAGAGYGSTGVLSSPPAAGQQAQGAAVGALSPMGGDEPGLRHPPGYPSIRTAQPQQPQTAGAGGGAAEATSPLGARGISNLSGASGGSGGKPGSSGAVNGGGGGDGGAGGSGGRRGSQTRPARGASSGAGAAGAGGDGRLSQSYQCGMGAQAGALDSTVLSAPGAGAPPLARVYEDDDYDRFTVGTL